LAKTVTSGVLALSAGQCSTTSALGLSIEKDDEIRHPGPEKVALCWP
jgi:hypothetical protein